MEIDFDHVPSREEVLGILGPELRLAYLWLEERADVRGDAEPWHADIELREDVALDLVRRIRTLAEVHVSWPIERSSVPGRYRMGRPRTQEFRKRSRLATEGSSAWHGQEDGFGAFHLQEVMWRFTIFRPWLDSGRWTD